MNRRHEILLRVTADGYLPMDDAGRAQHAKLKLGSIVGARIARSRSARHNALYWRVLEAVVKAGGRYDNVEHLHMALKVATGHVDVVRLLNGRLVKVPGSTSFDEMNQTEFTAYCTQAFRIICDEILGGMSIDELLAESGIPPAEAMPYTAAQQAMVDNGKFVDDVLEGRVGANTAWGG